MSKKTELVKSILLTVLVVMSIVLFANSWVREWSYSDNNEDSFIHKLAGVIGIGSVDSYAGENLSGSDVVSPSSVILTSGAKRVIVTKGTDMFSSYYGDILSILLCLDDVKTPAVSVTEQEWYSAQKTQAIYIDYGVTYINSVFSSALGASVPQEVSSLNAIILTSNNSATNKLVIFFGDSLTNKYYKVHTGKSARNVEKLLSDASGYTNLPLAVELGFNTSPEEGILQQVVIHGNALIDLEGTSVDELIYRHIENPASFLDNRSLNNLLSLFGMSKSSATQYANKDGASMYIDTYGTLSFYDENYIPVIEYTAANSQKGKKLFSYDTSDNILYNMTCSSYNQAHFVNDIFGIEGMDLKIASNVTSVSTENDSTTLFYIDYCYKGAPVFVNNKGIAEHGVQLKFNAAGELIYYKQKLYDVSPLGSHTNMPPALDAINNIYSLSTDSSRAVYVKDIFKGYQIRGGSASAIWCASLKGDNNIYTIETN